MKSLRQLLAVVVLATVVVAAPAAPSAGEPAASVVVAPVTPEQFLPQLVTQLSAHFRLEGELQLDLLRNWTAPASSGGSVGNDRRHPAAVARAADDRAGAPHCGAAQPRRVEPAAARPTLGRGARRPTADHAWPDSGLLVVRFPADRFHPRQGCRPRRRAARQPHRRPRGGGGNRAHLARCRPPGVGCSAEAASRSSPAPARSPSR